MDSSDEVGIGFPSTPGYTRMLNDLIHSAEITHQRPVPLGPQFSCQESSLIYLPHFLCLFQVPTVLYIFTHSYSTLLITLNYRACLFFNVENGFISFWALRLPGA